MKYEFKAGMRIFIPLWLGTLVLAVVNSLFGFFQDRVIVNGIQEFLFNVVSFAYIFALLAIVAVSVIYIIMRFYQGTVKDEGYLTFTLPVRIDAIIWGKALSGMIILVVSGLIAVLSFCILFANNFDFSDFQYAIRRLVQIEEFGSLALTVFLGILVLLAGCLHNIHQLYLVIGIGQLAQKRKVGVSVLAYVVISIVTASVLPFLMDQLDGLEWAWTKVSQANGLHGVWLVLGGMILYNLIMTAIYYFPTRYIFKNKLNLE